LKHGHTPVALDPDAGACTYVGERFGVQTIPSRVEDAELDRVGTFDAVLMLNLIEHLEDPGDVMRLLRPFLKDGGLVGIETPNILRTKVGPKRMYSFPHNYYFSPDSLLRMVSARGYEPVQCREFPLDMFHLLVRKAPSDAPVDCGAGPTHAAVVRRAIETHRWAYYARLQFLLRKIPKFRERYLYGNYQDRHFTS
jgi:SAM-dependent methyltransferase